ncbi:Anthranilate phosphoribosyltransferase [bacterium HR17]|uniref:Anthranilate phosphoribosyltransferase n=1 Tax=Candidatus Fervidibacter japonicus TaxID=2035412 RepID=A0A2H5XEE9_9BACT|nr:Anthranilate phosphoribosyltransferase [bacterium HR17]
MSALLDALRKVVNRENLTQEAAKAAMGVIMRGEATPAQIAAFLVALRMKGETVAEISGFAEAMKESAVKVDTKRRPVVDTCGTGGDRIKTFNVSTAAAFVVAGAGVTVAKHGNRSVTSKAGSADVLEALGFNLQMPPERAKQALDDIGVAFLFAPNFHPAMKHAAGPRREIGLRTVFNLLGPIVNPCPLDGQVVGVYDGALTTVVARVLANLGVRRGFVVHSLDGMDELSVTSATQVSAVRDNEVHTFVIFPEDLGFQRTDPRELEGGTPQENAQLLRAILSGEVKGAKRDVVVLNAATAIAAAGVVDDIKDAIPIAEEAIDSGAALRKLEALIAFSQKVAR